MMRAGSKFFETSKVIANEFLQSIVFVDDRAYTNEEANTPASRRHDFNALSVTKAFANEEKICAVYRPETASDIDKLAILSKKADVTVLDWQILLQEEPRQEDSEKDADNDDPRGPHTRRIIREILSDPLNGKGSLKLIIVYTGEVDLPDITESIFDDLNEQGIEGIQKGHCEVFTDNIKILIIGKSSNEEMEPENRFRYNPELNEKIVKYEDLPAFILTEFSKLTTGLLSNFILKSLAILRNNTFRLIKLYKKELDPAFLSHRFLLPNQEDSKEQLVETLTHSIQALLNYNDAASIVSTEQIEAWIDEYQFADTVLISNKTVTLNNNYLKSWAGKGLEKALVDFWEENRYDGAPNTDNFTKKIYEKGSSYLLTPGTDSNIIDCEFSILTHHKSNFKQPALIPKMSLGTLIKQISEGEESRYYLCLQAKCDSVRLTDVRRFLFIPLTVATNVNKFQIVIKEENFIKLQIKKDAFDLRTIKFKPADTSNAIIAKQEIDSLCTFESIYNEKFIWICDLKDLHAQRVANNYAAQISRVGLDESEWLRRRS